MNFYNERILPHLLNLAMRHKHLAAYSGVGLSPALRDACLRSEWALV